MGKIILVTGGARSGKSSFAENLLKGKDINVLYIATAIAFDDEMKSRIKKHRESRPDNWETYEGFKNIGDGMLANISNKQGVLLDCITVMVTNLMFDYLGFNNKNPSVDEFNDVEKIVQAEIIRLMEVAKTVEATFVLVTNELGSGIVPENSLSRGFRDIAGRMNQLVARYSDEVYLTVCGIPLKIK